MKDKKGVLYFGDNYEILKEHIKDKSVDLIYLDPPFNSKAQYNVLFKSKGDDDAPSQLKAFNDTWKWGEESRIYYDKLISYGDDISTMIYGLRQTIGTNDMMAYLVMMAVRLIQLRRVLKDTGSIFLHCDPTASHYLKVLMDCIFGGKNFRNEIIWKKTNSTKEQADAFGKQHDIIFWYSKTDDYLYKPVSRELDGKSKKPFCHDDDDGRGLYQTIALSNTTESGGFSKMKVWKWRGVKARWIYSKATLEEWWAKGLIYKTKSGYRKKDFLSDKEKRGITITDIWTDTEVAPIQKSERLGYATQKPISLLERILNASSAEGQLVLDPFCGCGTAIEAAHKLNRNYVGIDVTHLAIGLIEYRMKKAFGVRPKVIGVPTTLESAMELAERDKFQFEAWAVTRIDGIKPNEKKGKDRGIDGRGIRIIGKDEQGLAISKKVVVSVKGGQNIGPSMIRDLKGTVEREGAGFGVFICIREPTKEMVKEATSSSMVETNLGQSYPEIQIYTIKDYFDKIKPDLPPARPDD